MKLKFTKKLTCALLVGAMAVTMLPISASAISLKDSFSCGTYMTCKGADWLGTYWAKSCWAATNGYYKNHYVRAMVGTTSNAWADTGRRYSNGNIKRTCTTGSMICNGFSWEFPTGHAYYGN